MPEIKVYDTHFNVNEWFVLIGLGVGIAVILFLPRRFSRKLSILYFICGATFGAVYDLTLGSIPISFYDIGDNSNYDFMDIVSIFMYGPYSYLFFYIYDVVKVRLKYVPIYILAWTLLSISIEWLGVRLGVYHYDAGFWMGVSFEIYLFVHTFWVVFYYVMRRLDASFQRAGSPRP